jgi:hypothetical protein
MGRNPRAAGYRCLACGFAHPGRDTEAQEAATHVLELDPAFYNNCLYRSGRAIKLEAINRRSSESGAARMSPLRR